MTALERKELIDILVKDYIYYKEWDQAWQKENSPSHMIALGKLQGVCVALNLDFNETDSDFTVFTRDKKKLVTKIEK